MDSKTTFFIAADHPAFAGHFPGFPILPGVLLLDAAVHLLTQATRDANSPQFSPQSSPQAICQISSAKFLSPVTPGEMLTITCTTTASAHTRFDISGGNRKVATGMLSWARPS